MSDYKHDNKKKLLKDLNLVDRFLFTKTIEDPEAYEALLAILLERSVLLKKDKTQAEKELLISEKLKSVRLDVLGEEEEGKVWYTEMQKRNTGNLVRRGRYYQAQIDSSLLESGTKDYNELVDSCMILIAPFDIFGRGRIRYTFRMKCYEEPDLEIDDGITHIFINTKWKNMEDFSEEFLALMEYVTESDESIFDATKCKNLAKIHNRVTKVRNSETMRVSYMQAWEEIEYAKDDAREEGREEGILLGQQSERANTLREKQRADAAEARVAELEAILQQSRLV